jgi:hypothetical protein
VYFPAEIQTGDFRFTNSGVVAAEPRWCLSGVEVCRDATVAFRKLIGLVSWFDLPKESGSYKPLL